MNDASIMHEVEALRADVSDVQDGQPKDSAYRTELGKNLPNAGLVQLWIVASVFPEEVREVAQGTKLGLDKQRLVFFPAVDIAQHIGMTATKTRRMRRIGQVLQDIHFLTKAQP